MSAPISIASILGPWVDSDFDSGLIQRCKNAWNKPLQELSNGELATLLGQKIAVAHLLPIAKARVAVGVDDDTEFYDCHLAEVVRDAEKPV